jgi:transposase-like protein
MVYTKVLCPYCGSENVVLFGKSERGAQRYSCKNAECKKTFILDYKYNACKPGIHEKIVEMTMNGAGTRDTGRALNVSKDTVTAVLKNEVIPRKS